MHRNSDNGIIILDALEAENSLKKWRAVGGQDQSTGLTCYRTNTNSEQSNTTKHDW